MVKHLHLKGFVALAAAFATSMGAFAATPISDAAGLAAIGNDLAGEYELTADIDLTGEWMPIGTSDAPFTGTFDGKGHTIKGLTYTTNGNWVGLFGASTGTIKNVRIVEANIYGNEHVGIAVGRVFGGGVVDNVFTAGYVCGRDHEGGIAGDAGDTNSEATISNCLSTAYVNGREYQAGGIVGWTKGTVTIENNIFLGEVYCGGWGANGGIVGLAEDGTTTVTHNVCAARILKGNSGNGRDTQGIVGFKLNDNSIVVSTDNLISAETLIINKDNGEVVDHATLTPDLNGISTPVADLQKATTYKDLSFGSAWDLRDGHYPVLGGMTLPINGDFIHTAVLPAEVFVNNVIKLAPVSTYGGREVTVTTNDASVATVEGSTVTFVKAGTVTITLTTEGDAFCAGATLKLVFNPSDFDATIATAADMEKLRENPSGDFVLTADIDMTGIDFVPVPSFTGSLDGQGHYIRNLSIVNKERNKSALFQEFGGTFVKNLGFEKLYIVGNADAAAVAGKTTSNGVISGVVVSNSYIEGRDHTASFVGNLDGNATITNCISNAELFTREYQGGGIAGVSNYGTVEKCIFAGTVTGGNNTNITGIVSLLDSDGGGDATRNTIKNCLAAAVSYTNSSSATNTIIALADRQMTLENNYVAEYSLKNEVAVAGGNANGTEGGLATTDEVRTQTWYVDNLGFDFTNDWKFLDGGEGLMLPVLKWMNAPLPTIVFNMPDADGVNITYFEGTESWKCNVLMGSWGQSVTVTQVSGFDYAILDETDNSIYVGNEEGELPYGGGTASFKVSLPASMSDLFTLEGRVDFDVNVSENGVEKTISTVEEFLNIRKNPSGTYILGADIDLAGVDFNGFCVDGKTSFTGTLDGRGHSIKNFKLDFTAGGNDKGLFGKVSGATFKNVAFVDFYINGGTSGAKQVGVIGGGSAYIENCAFVGTVIGNDHVGIVAGDSDGIEMHNCYAVGSVTGSSQVGGFFGCTLEGGCVLENCLSNVRAEATYRGWVGGFVGLIDKANSAVTIKNCVSIGDCYAANGSGTPKVTAPFIAGNGAGDEALAVVTFSGNIYNSAAIYDADTQWPAKNETAEGGVIEGATAMNPNNLSVETPYTGIGWDFNEVWAMGTGDYKYPVLATVAVSDFTLSGVEDVVAAPEATVSVAAANGEIIVAGLGEASVITVYNAAGVQVAAVNVNAPEAVVAAPAAGLYIVSVATDGAVTTAKVVVK